MLSLRRALLATLVLVVSCSSSSSSSPGASSGDGGGDDAGGGDDVGGDDSGGGTDGSKPPNPDVKNTTEQFDFGGTTRKYLLSIPVDYDASKKYPLVMEFHGNPGTAEYMHDAFPFEGVSKREAIVAYPNALGTDWDLFNQDNPDMGFVRALKDALIAKYAIDPNRVFGWGWSGGAFFVNQIACRYSGVFRALSSQSGGAPLDVTPGDESTYSKCTGGPMAFFIVHGTADGTVDYGSGVSDAMVWAKIDGCQSSQSPTTPAPCQKQNGCPTATPVVFCGIEGAGHAPWSQTLSATWEFFKSFP